MLLKVSNQIGAMLRALPSLPQTIDFEARALDSQNFPEPRKHDDQLGVDIRPCEPERFDVDLMKLAEAAALRPLVPKQRTHRPDALWPVVGQAMFDRSAHRSRCEFGA